MVHGGIITALLDEAMAWAGHVRGIWAVTARIDVRFRRPVAIGETTRVIGRVVSDRGRLLETAAELRRGDDVLLADAVATFARVPEDQARVWRARYLR
jgi:acyl-coenzyme A thioesterase PaaI-like protein